MASSNPQIIGGGIQAGSITLDEVLYVSNVSPPQASSFVAKRAQDSVSNVVYLAIPNSVGTYPSVTNATEGLRVQGGMIVSGTGTDSVQIGRGAVASGQDGISVGRGSSATATDAVAIGRGSGATVTKTTIVGSNSNDNGTACTVLGWGSGALSSSGIAIGIGAVISGNAGGSNAIAIGDNATATNSSAGGGTTIAIGVNATSRTGDVVIGGNASSNVQSVFGNNNVVVGQSAAGNVAQGNVVAVGASAVVSQVTGVAIGAGAQATAASGQTRGIAIGGGTTVTATDAIAVGGGSALTTKSIVLGAGGVDLGAAFLQLGAPGTPITTVVFGAGDTIATPAAKTIRFTNGTGTDNAAGNVTLVAPLSTGNATPAAVVIQVGVQVAGSSSTLQTPGNAVTFTHTTAGGHLATLGGAVKTAAPNGGTAANWKLGSYVGAVIVPDGNYVEVDIGGTLYKLCTGA